MRMMSRPVVPWYSSLGPESVCACPSSSHRPSPPFLVSTRRECRRSSCSFAQSAHRPVRDRLCVGDVRTRLAMASSSQRQAPPRAFPVAVPILIARRSLHAIFRLRSFSCGVNCSTMYRPARHPSLMTQMMTRTMMSAGSPMTYVPACLVPNHTLTLVTCTTRTGSRRRDHKSTRMHAGTKRCTCTHIRDKSINDRGPHVYENAYNTLLL